MFLREKMNTRTIVIVRVCGGAVSQAGDPQVLHNHPPQLKLLLTSTSMFTFLFTGVQPGSHGVESIPSVTGKEAGMPLGARKLHKETWN